ncbi:hypothetical protein NEMIN01_0865 [Nematocida minor]|uniref:uncharacterized protein n=1 Tax=Nematocida minor TaxID=1912983 RepID=UPI00222060FB|nr:uncharacterized protein NEMIN01_0865 [Nematocida minor]KAI5190080.1 hypothetical protein NEMIN01_0865 [Nematocida minor]
MIFQRTVKKVLIMAAYALVCTQQARCRVAEKNISTIKTYWFVRIDSMEKEIVLRTDFLKRIEAVGARALLSAANGDAYTSLSFDEKIRTGNKYLSEIVAKKRDLEKSVSAIAGAAGTLMDLYRYKNNRFFLDYRNKHKNMIKKEKNTLERLLLPALENSTQVIEKINEYDLHMLEMVEQYGLVENTNIDGLVLFKLAKKNKIVAAKIIFYLFEMEPCEIENNTVGVAERMHKDIMAHIQHENVKLFISAIRDDIKDRVLKSRTEVLISAGVHVHLLFDRCSSTHKSNPSVLDAETMNVYLSLLKDDLTESDISLHADITPRQVMGVLAIEFLLNGHLLDHKRNSLFSALGKVISSIGNPADSSTNVCENIRKGRAQQNKILDALGTLWNECNLFTSIKHENIASFQKEKSISFSNSEWMANSLISSEWMYDLDTHSPSFEDKFNMGIHFDMSYTHPLWYICQRCENASHLTSNNMRSNLNLFEETENTIVVLRPHRINKTDDDSVRAENMKSCIKAWFAPVVEIISREEDGREYNSIANDFSRYLGACQQKIVTIKITSETIEASECRDNVSRL